MNWGWHIVRYFSTSLSNAAAGDGPQVRQCFEKMKGLPMKTWMKVVLGIFAGIAALLGLIFWLTGDITKAGDDFFVAIADGDTEQAYELLSPQFKSNASPEDFKSYLRKTGLVDVESVSWNSRSISGDVGDLEGSMTTKSGDRIPLEMKLVKTEDGWKVFNLHMQSAGFATGSATALPSITDQLLLVDATTDTFSDAVTARDMSIYHKFISPMWQEQITPAKLEEIFGGFYEFADKVKNLKDLPPRLRTESTIDDNGILAIKGYYDGPDDRAIFTYKYIFEGLKWRPIGHKLDLVR